VLASLSKDSSIDLDPIRRSWPLSKTVRLHFSLKSNMNYMK